MSYLTIIVITIVILSNEHVFSSANPLSCDVNVPVKVTFYQITNSGRSMVTNLSVSTFNAQAENTYFIVHGYHENTFKVPRYEDIATAIIQNEDANAILVDYGDVASKFYSCAGHMVKVAGGHFSAFLNEQIEDGYLDPAKTVIVGHSLGAHVSGFAARNVTTVTGQKIRRVTALDAAGPLFSWPFKWILTQKYRLRKTDAEFVDALHTSAFFGSFEPVGTVDTYAIGLLIFTFQPHCLIHYQWRCSHSMSLEYYLESVSSCGIRAKNIHGDNVPYGLHMPEDVSGLYYFFPNFEPPYGKGDAKCS